MKGSRREQGNLDKSANSSRCEGEPARITSCHKKLEVAVGLEPTKTGFAGQRLDHFGIATLENLYPNSM
jgi:hypothetical protein